MALGSKYENTFEAADGNQYKWQILEEGGSGATALDPVGRDFIRTSYKASGDNEYSPFLVSTTSISVYDNASGDLFADVVEQLSDSSEDRYVLRITDVTDSNQVKWQGYVKRGSARKSEDGLPIITLTASDGIDMLKRRTFTSTSTTVFGKVEEVYTGRVTYTSIVATLLGKIGFGFNFNVHSQHYPRLRDAALTANGGSQLDAADNPWDNVYVDRNTYKVKGQRDGERDRPVYCYDVIKDILTTWGCTMYQWDGEWWIIQVNERGDSTIRWWNYDSSGAAIGTPGYTDATDHQLSPSSLKIDRTMASIDVAEPYDAVTVGFQHGEYKFMRNPGFDIRAAGIFSYDPDYWTITNRGSGRYENLGKGDGQFIARTVQTRDLDSIPTSATGTGADSIDLWVSRYADNAGLAIEEYLTDAIGTVDGSFSGTLTTMDIDAWGGNYVASGEGLWVKDSLDDYRRIQLSEDLRPGDTTINFDSAAVGILAASIHAKKTSTVSSTSEVEISDGQFIEVRAQFYPSLQSGDSNVTIYSQGIIRRAYYQVKLEGASGTRYLKRSLGLSGYTWVSDVAWISQSITGSDWNNIILRVTDPTPFAGSITITVGPSVEYVPLQYVISRATAPFTFDEVRWDNVDVLPVVSWNNPNANGKSITVYDDGQATEIAREYKVPVMVGDAPYNPALFGMTLDSDGLLGTTDWEEAPVGGTESDVDHETLLGKVILRSIRAPRQLHSASYYGLSVLPGPYHTLTRSGSDFAVMSLDINWNREYVDGTWYKVTETGFTDGSNVIRDSAALVGTKGGIGAATAGFFGSIGNTLFADGSATITRTSSEILTTDSPVTSIDVEAINEPIFKAGDLISLIGPDLSFQQARISADQDALATTLSIEDVDNPGVGVTFESDFGVPSAIYFLEQELLTLARLGEQGFAVTVLGENLGQINETKGPASYTTLAVTNWGISVAADTDVYITESNGDLTPVTLAAAAPRGSTSISFYLPGGEIGDAVELDVTSGDAIKPTGTVNRADFQVTADAITAYIGNPGGIIATMASDSTWDGTNTSLPVGTSLTDDLKADDPILIYTPSGTVVKATVNANVSAAASPIVLTAADGNLTATLVSGSKIVPGSLTGLRIDMDNIEFTADQINSAGYSAGTAGWAIFNDGSAEFNNVNVRGTITLTGASSGITNFGDAGAAVTWDDADDVLDGASKRVTTTDEADGGGYAFTGLTSGGILKTSAIPAANVGTPGAAGLYLGADYMGYHDGSGIVAGWKTYMDNSGNFYLGGTSGSLQWNGSNLSIEGSVTITGGSGIAQLTDAGALAVKDTVDTGDIDNDAITTVKIADGQITAAKITVSSLSAISANIGSITAGDLNIGSGTFIVTSGGALTATSATITGAITATSGSLSGLSVSGTLTMGASGEITDAGSNFTIDANGISAAAGTSSPSGGTDPKVINAGNMLMYGFTSTAGGSHSENYLYGDGGTTSNTNIFTEGALIIDTNGTGTGGTGESLKINFTDDFLLQAIDGLAEIKIQSDYIRLNGSAGGAAILTTNGNTIWHAGNDGTGSGLDADLLDGNEATAFITSAGDGITKSSQTLSLSKTAPAVVTWPLDVVGFDGDGNYADTSISSFGASLIDDADASAARTTLGLGSLATLSTINNSNWSGTDLAVTNGGTGASSAANARTNLGLAIGTNVQAYDAHLDDLAGLATVSGAEDIMVSTGAGTWGYQDAVFVESSALNATAGTRGPKFVGSGIYGSGGNPGSETFSGWLYVRVGGSVYRVPLYANGA